MLPFVNKLFQNAGVGMLRDEIRSQQLQPLGGDLGDNRRIVQEPPTAERHQIAEFSCSDAQLVLVFARKKGREKAHIGVLYANSLDRGNVRTSDAVARGAKGGVDAAAHADHHRKRQIMFAGRWENYLV